MAVDQLRDLLVRHSYRYSDEPIFKLASGRLSQFYVNCKTTTMRREAARLIAAAFDRFIPREAEGIGGLTMGADPIAYAVRDFGTVPLDAFVVRKRPKEHGLKQAIEGPLRPGMKVVVVDDVVTTGGSTIDAIRACREHELALQVVAVVVLVDREEDEGLEKIRREAGCPVHAIFKVSELKLRWNQLHADDRGHLPRPLVAVI